MEQTQINKEFLKKFEPNNADFIVDIFEEMIINDMAQSDTETLKKLNRDLTDYFFTWLINKMKNKEQIKLNIKGQVRSGKSIVGLKIQKVQTDFYKKPFNTEYIVCANQKELRQKLQDCDFADGFLIDEKSFSNTGIGSMSEMQQMKDIENIIAKNNNHLTYITPRTFIDTGASLGLAHFGKDSNQWLSRFLLYSLSGNFSQLLGYVVFDVGSLFRDTGCFIYKFTGGCTNPKNLTFKDIENLSVIKKGDVLENSYCIQRNDKGEIDKSLLTDQKKQCPFYNICNNPMCQYEHKKDKWIEREMKGGLTEREQERYKLALKLFQSLARFSENGDIRLNAKNGKEIKLKIKMKLPTLSNAKLTGVEIDEIHQTVISLTGMDFFRDLCKSVNLDYAKELEKIDGYSELLNEEENEDDEE